MIISTTTVSPVSIVRISIVFALFALSLLPAYGQWKPMPTPPGASSVTAFTVSGKEYYAMTMDRVYRTVDNGVTWAELAKGLPPRISILTGLSVMDGEVYVGVPDSGIYRFDRAAERWSKLAGAGLPQDTAERDLYGTFPHGNILFAAVSSGGKDVQILRSLDKGETWENVPNMRSIGNLVSSDSTLYHVVSGSTLNISTDNGDSWSRVDVEINEGLVGTFATNGSVWVVGGMTMGIAISYDKGEYWHHLDESHGIPRTVNVAKVVMRGPLAIAVGTFNHSSDGSVHVSDNGGESWRQLTEGVRPAGLAYAFIGDEYIYISNGHITYYRPRSEVFPQMEVSAEAGIAGPFALNVVSNRMGSPAAISLHLPHPTYLHVALFDINGTERITLATGKWEKGEYTIPLDTRNLPAGAYYCRGIDGQSVVTQPLLIVR